MRWTLLLFILLLVGGSFINYIASGFVKNKSVISTMNMVEEEHKKEDDDDEEKPKSYWNGDFDFYISNTINNVFLSSRKTTEKHPQHIVGTPFTPPDFIS